MFDIGWPELVVVLIVAILVIGPRDLPKAFYTIGKWVRAARRVTSDFQRHVDDMMREAELDDLRKVADQARSLNVKKQIENVIDPSGDLKDAFDVNAPAGGTKESPATSPSTPTPSGASVPVETKAEASSADAAPAKPAKPVKQAAKTASSGRKRTAKASPRVPSRVPKRAPKGGGTSRRPATAKASTPESTS